MLKYESENYIFEFANGSEAQRDILSIADEQEACFEHICRVLDTKPCFKINYILCNSPEEVGRLYGDNQPCSGFAVMPSTIYAVYNDKIKCIGFHEDAHIISYTINKPDCPAIREGLAMYFDRKWWGIENIDWCGYFIESKQYISAAELLKKELFYKTNDAVSYPIMGAFTDYLISTYGKATYRELYKKQNIIGAMEEIYGKSPTELDKEFVKYVRLFRIDDELKRRMAKLIAM